ncbi:hypothetical protein Zmor_026002 [Zophobas morio]|uniref:Uncharacterized protein n=1 Tax=Zophobas morio TaxID=2755281 RepID=A0AA38M481_9CUCU|nr:hypothetical protein Zmor_026002 [Zophobas morio]
MLSPPPLAAGAAAGPRPSPSLRFFAVVFGVFVLDVPRSRFPRFSAEGRCVRLTSSSGLTADEEMYLEITPRCGDKDGRAAGFTRHTRTASLSVSVLLC